MVKCSSDPEEPEIRFVNILKWILSAVTITVLSALSYWDTLYGDDNHWLMMIQWTRILMKI